MFCHQESSSESGAEWVDARVLAGEIPPPPSAAAVAASAAADRPTVDADADAPVPSLLKAQREDWVRFIILIVF